METYLVELVFAFFGVVDGGRVPVLGEVACCYEAVAACGSNYLHVLEEDLLLISCFLPLLPGPHTTRTFLPALIG